MRTHAKLLLSVVLVGCAANVDEEIPTDSNALLISYSPMYSAFDGTHEYALTPSIPSAAAAKEKDPILASSIKWELDAAFVKQEDFPDLPGGVKLTTKKAGKTSVFVTLKTLSGHAIRTEAQLTISRAKESEWEAGESRYNNGDLPQDNFDTSMCGLVEKIELPDASSCSHCHTSMFAVEPTPTQTAGYSNQQLINIFTEGAKPAGGTFNSPFLRAAPMPDCIYKSFHTWPMSDEEKNGIVWKLRSMPPRVLEEYKTRL